MPFRYPSDPAERAREMRREDRFIVLMTIISIIGVVLAVIGIIEETIR